MNRFFAILVGFAVIALSTTAIAGVTGTEHDLSTGNEGPCIYCHVPHGAAGGVGEYLWPTTPSSAYLDQRNLCVTCHDGAGSEPGFTTVFDATLQQHKFPSNMTTPDCSGDGACHDVHNQAVANNRFLSVTATGGSYCVTCHDATSFPGYTLDDQTAGTQHPMTGGFSCENCHIIHGAEVDAFPPSGVTHPILLESNSDGSGVNGTFCVSCHQGTAPGPDTLDVGTIYGGVAASDTFTYVEATVDGTEDKHPTEGGDHGGPAITGCNECHDPHNAATAPASYDFALQETNTDSDFCESCHSGLTGDALVTVGDGSTHYIGLVDSAGMNSSTSPYLPWSDEIDDDGVVGPDYTSPSADWVVCESCHSVHRNALQGATGTNFLRNTYQSSTICGQCHTDNI